MRRDRVSVEVRRRALTDPEPTTPALGLMLRRAWIDALLRDPPADLTWIELFPENHLWRGEPERAHVEALAQHWPLTSHGVHLSIGDDAPLSEPYLDALGAFLERVDAPWFSDHLGMATHDGHILHEIVPIPLDEATLDRVSHRVEAVQARMGRPFLIENTAAYVIPPGTTMSESAFLARLVERTGCGLLLDVNNLWVNASNHGVPVDAWLDEAPLHATTEIHIGGFTVDARHGLLIDSHGAAPSPPVWRLLEEALRRVGPRPVLVEWETHMPSLQAVLALHERVRHAWRRACRSSTS
jgi:uncharacterized protein (UPF0276 family)